MHTVFNQGLWVASALLLFVVALVRFSRPPTNRTGTTFILFYTGVLFYYALLIGLWLLVIVLLSAGSYGVDGIGPAVSVSLKANEWLNPSLPVVGLLVIAVASRFKLVGKMDAGARQVCIQLAAIPAEAEQLAVELAHGELELKDRALIENISNDIRASAPTLFGLPTTAPWLLVLHALSLSIGYLSCRTMRERLLVPCRSQWTLRVHADHAPQ